MFVFLCLCVSVCVCVFVVLLCVHVCCVARGGFLVRLCFVVVLDEHHAICRRHEGSRRRHLQLDGVVAADAALQGLSQEFHAS